MRLAGPVLAAQSFAGNLVVRGVGAEAVAAALQPPSAARFLLVAERQVAVLQVEPQGQTSPLGSTAGSAVDGGPSAVPAAGAAASLLWLDLGGLSALQLQRDPAADGSRLTHAPSGAAAAVYALGSDALRGGALALAVDVSGLGEGALAASHPGASLRDLRALMPLLPAEELALAGQAVALSQWHQAHRFCGRCGAPTEPAEGGGRRQCTAQAGHRLYPRTDPVAIMLVESPSGTHCLLGRSKKIRAGMLTCLSGFIDQGESIEEAVAREVREEAGVDVSAVDIVGSQPWPIGRGGSCELMVGCIAKARSEEIVLNEEEMEEVRWIAREDVLRAVQDSSQPDNPYLGGKGSTSEGIDFFIPPPMAIAHHLIKAWASHEGSWFGGADAPASHL